MGISVICVIAGMAARQCFFAAPQITIARVTFLSFANNAADFRWSTISVAAVTDKTCCRDVFAIEDRFGSA